MLINIFLKKKLQSNNIKNISNIILILVSLLTYINCLYDYNYILNLQILLIYLGLELFFTPLNHIDIIIHHILTIMNIYYAFHYNIDLINNFYSTKQFLLLETSSIFLGLKEVVNNENLKKIFRLIFIFLFIKIRLYHFTFNIISNIEVFDSYDKDIIQFYWQYLCIYGLYFLQIYWGCIIVKVISKGVFKNMPLYKGENILKYTYIFNQLTTIFSYYYLLETDENLLMYGKYALIDIFGNTSILVSSYYFHNNCYENLVESESNNREYTVITLKHKNYLLFDIASINVRMLCQILTHMFMHEIPLSENYNFIIGFLSICTLQLAIIDVIYYVHIKNFYTKFSTITHNFLLILMGVPPTITVLSSVNNIYEINTVLNTYVYLYFLICLELIEPFYKNTQIFLHLAMCLANYKMALNNTYYIRNNM